MLKHTNSNDSVNNIVTNHPDIRPANLREISTLLLLVNPNFHRDRSSIKKKDANSERHHQKLVWKNEYARRKRSGELLR